MTQTFATDANNDLFLDKNGNIAIYTQLDAVLQCCEHAVQTLLGEMVLATDQGIPYMQTVFVGVPNLQIFESALREAILDVPDVTTITSLIISQEADVLQYTAVIQTIYGTGPATGSVSLLGRARHG